MRLKGKVAIITGAGAGQGRAAALLFSKEGAKVVIAELDPAKGKETENLVRDAGGDALFVQTDVSKADQVQRMVAESVKRYGRINVLYNNAGIPHKDDHTVTLAPNQAWDQVLNVNLRGPFLCSKYAIPEMVKSGGGSIINTSSVAAVVALEGTIYGISKAGVLALTKAIAKQYGDKGIRCNNILPGAVDTDFSKTLAERRARRRASGVAQVSSMIERKATADEVAHMALFLASDESSFITGADFSIDGGTTAR